MNELTALDALRDALDALRSINEPVNPAEIASYRVDDDGLILSETVEYIESAELAEASALRGATSYTGAIRAIARAVWQGKEIDALTRMWERVGLGISGAWRQGAASCGIAESDLTTQELVRREMIIIEQRSHILGFLSWVHTHRRDGDNKLLWRALQSRINAWGNAWNKAFNESKARACANQKLKWVLHGRRVTKVPCKDCLKLNGRIYRASTWARWLIFPQSLQLFCSGFN